AARAAGKQVERARTPLVAETAQGAVPAVVAAACGRGGQQAALGAEAPCASEPGELQAVGELGMALQRGRVAHAATAGRAEHRIRRVVERGLAIAATDRAQF